MEPPGSTLETADVAENRLCDLYTSVCPAFREMVGRTHPFGNQANGRRRT